MEPLCYTMSSVAFEVKLHSKIAMAYGSNEVADFLRIKGKR
jgi:hypothetical protein